MKKKDPKNVPFINITYKGLLKNIVIMYSLGEKIHS